MKIEVTVSPKGEVTVKVNGVQGKSCQDLTRPLEQALGKTTGDSKTPEFYQQGNQQVRQ